MATFRVGQRVKVHPAPEWIGYTTGRIEHLSRYGGEGEVIAYSRPSNAIPGAHFWIVKIPGIPDGEVRSTHMAPLTDPGAERFIREMNRPVPQVRRLLDAKVEA